MGNSHVTNNYYPRCCRFCPIKYENEINNDSPLMNEPLDNKKNQNKTVSINNKLLSDQDEENSKDFKIFRNIDWFSENYKPKITLLGSGGFGTVVSAIKKRDNKEVAIKLMKTENFNDMDTFIKEALTLSTLKHPNILEFLDYHVHETKFMKNNQNFSEYQLFISMEKADGTLKDLLEIKDLNIVEILKVMTDLIKGLSYAHTHHKISHNDIKPQNIFYRKTNKKNEISYKIGDWGSGAFLRESNTLTSWKKGMGYTKNYASPEVIKDEHNINFYKSDIYSLGLTLLRCCGVEFRLFKNINDYEKDEHDQKIDQIFQNVVMNKMDKDVSSILRAMVSYNFEDRIDLNEEVIKLIDNKYNALNSSIIEKPRVNTNNEKIIHKFGDDNPENLPSLKLKLVLIGDSNVGKTCLIHKYSTGKMTYFPTTMGIDFQTKEIRKAKAIIKLAIWDTAGQEKYRSITQNFYKDSNGFMIIFDLNKIESFNNLPYWVKQIVDNAHESVSILLVGNKCDRPRQVDKKLIEDFSSERDLFYLETSALTGQNIDQIFSYFVEDAYKKYIKQEESFGQNNENIVLKNKENPNSSLCC